MAPKGEAFEILRSCFAAGDGLRITSDIQWSLPAY